MVNYHKPTGRALSMPAGLIYGAAVSLTITILSALLLAKMLDAEVIAWENVGYGIMILLLMSSTLGSLSACGKIKRQRLVVCALSGAIYFGLLMSITALFFGGQYEAVGVTAILILGGSTSAGLLGLQKERGGRRRNSIRPHC